ncbi:MAG: glycosyltransferase family 4 protein [Candidatus Moranbacteria bacterium]|nr:glycosyltransferase family 4 protein [Candidatus Moranbacteria bacterium]
MKIVFISGMLPSGHYSQYITRGLNEHQNVELLVYADKNPKNVEIQNCGTIKMVWSKSLRYIPEILSEIKKDKPDVVHLQHELNMYGGILTASFFPLLVVALRLQGIRVVTTVHAAVFRRQVDDAFMKLFHQDSPLLRPFMLTFFFHYVYKMISLFSHALTVHTHLTKEILVTDYGVDPKKVNVIPIAIPQREINNSRKEKYFFYFGYMVRRKGLGFALEGFRRYIEENPGSDYKFILAGGVIKGQEKAYDEIMQIIKDNHLEEKVIVRGFIEQEEQDDLYEKAYAVVIPAVVSMGSSGPLFHSVSYGKAVICSKIGHFLEDIEDGKTGILTDNDRFHEAFKFAAEHPEKIVEIEKNVETKARSRTPFETARKTLALYTR